MRLRLPSPSATQPRAAPPADGAAGDGAVAAEAAAAAAGVALEFETQRDVLGEGRDVSEVITVRARFSEE